MARSRGRGAKGGVEWHVGLEDSGFGRWLVVVFDATDDSVRHIAGVDHASEVAEVILEAVDEPNGHGTVAGQRPRKIVTTPDLGPQARWAARELGAKVATRLELPHLDDFFEALARLEGEQESVPQTLDAELAEAWRDARPHEGMGRGDVLELSGAEDLHGRVVQVRDSAVRLFASRFDALAATCGLGSVYPHEYIQVSWVEGGGLITAHRNDDVVYDEPEPLRKDAEAALRVAIAGPGVVQTGLGPVVARLVPEVWPPAPTEPVDERDLPAPREALLALLEAMRWRQMPADAHRVVMPLVTMSTRVDAIAALGGLEEAEREVVQMRPMIAYLLEQRRKLVPGDRRLLEVEHYAVGRTAGAFELRVRAR